MCVCTSSSKRVRTGRWQPDGKQTTDRTSRSGLRVYINTFILYKYTTYNNNTTACIAATDYIIIVYAAQYYYYDVHETRFIDNNNNYYYCYYIPTVVDTRSAGADVTASNSACYIGT